MLVGINVPFGVGFAACSKNDTGNLTETIEGRLRLLELVYFCTFVLSPVFL